MGGEIDDKLYVLGKTSWEVKGNKQFIMRIEEGFNTGCVEIVLSMMLPIF